MAFCEEVVKDANETHSIDVHKNTAEAVTNANKTNEQKK